jgi:DNA helicase-2/ATP-dependent DNA helicase PcrA
VSADKRLCLESFLEIYDAMVEKCHHTPLDQLIQEVFNRMLLPAHSNSEKKNNSPYNDNILDLMTASIPFSHVPASEGIPLFLNKITLSREGETVPFQQDAVSLLTIHGAKGLEFSVVFLIGMEEGLFPYLANTDSEMDNIEEERRLFYVGMTRAKEKLYLVYTHSRFLFGQCHSMPCSTFLADIPGELVTHHADPAIKKKLQEKHKPKQMRLFGD